MKKVERVWRLALVVAAAYSPRQRSRGPLAPAGAAAFSCTRPEDRHRCAVDGPRRLHRPGAAQLGCSTRRQDVQRSGTG